MERNAMQNPLSVSRPQKGSVHISQNTRLIIVFSVLSLLIVASVAMYIYSRTYANAFRLGVPMTPSAFRSILGRTIPHLVAMIASAVALAVVSLSFQTITQSRVLTPSMIGFDSVFIGTQTVLVFFLGAQHVLFADPFVNYFLTSGVMVVVSLFMFGAILRNSRNNIVFLLMFGLVLSGVVSNGARYLQIIMNESDFFQVAAATSVNVNNIAVGIVWAALPVLALVVIVIIWRHRKYNVMSLGPEQAKGLGVPYERELKVNLILIAIGMSAATALIGSLTFLGLLAVNAAREVLKTHKHLPLFIGSSMMAVLALVFGQGIMELMQGTVPVTAIIDIVGCSYIFYLILKENRI